jgi:hypothetical protein
VDASADKAAALCAAILILPIESHLVNTASTMFLASGNFLEDEKAASRLPLQR